MRLKAHVGKEFSGAFIIVMFLLLTHTFVVPSQRATFPRVLDHAYSPTTIAAGSLPMKLGEPVSDWFDALNWMRVNLKPTDVVASWWDYGYWITTIANKTTLADNGTINATQIARIGEMFLSTETEAIEILDEYDATHIVVFTTFRVAEGPQIIEQGWGDEGKWRWMARIAGLDESTFGEMETEGGMTYWNWSAKGKETVIYKLMRYGQERTLGISPKTVELVNFIPESSYSYFSQTPGNPKVYGGVIPLVCVYEIKQI